MWIWPQGNFTQESWNSVACAAGESAADYLNALREFSKTAADPAVRSVR